MLSLFVGPTAYSVLDTFNVGVGYGGINELTISTDSPGEFDYRLYLRTANNTGSVIRVHYNGVNNFSRSIRLNCATDEINAIDNPTTGTCISGGPFVRGAFIAGNSSKYARVKRFTLFCESVQVLGEESTNNWNADFDNSAIANFLDNGASSTWCPTPSPVVNKTFISPTNKPSTTKTPTPTASEEVSSSTDTSPTPNIITIASTQDTSTENKKPPNLFLLGSLVFFGILVALSYIKRREFMTVISPFLTKFKNPHPDMANLSAEDELVPPANLN